MDIAIFQSSYEDNPKGWNDAFAFFRSYAGLDADSRQSLDVAMAKVVKVNIRDMLTNSMAHQVDKEMGDEK